MSLLYVRVIQEPAPGRMTPCPAGSYGCATQTQLPATQSSPWQHCAPSVQGWPGARRADRVKVELSTTRSYSTGCSSDWSVMRSSGSAYATSAAGRNSRPA